MFETSDDARDIKTELKNLSINLLIFTLQQPTLILPTNQWAYPNRTAGITVFQNSLDRPIQKAGINHDQRKTWSPFIPSCHIQANRIPRRNDESQEKDRRISRCRKRRQKDYRWISTRSTLLTSSGMRTMHRAAQKSPHSLPFVASRTASWSSRPYCSRKARRTSAMCAASQW